MSEYQTTCVTVADEQAAASVAPIRCCEVMKATPTSEHRRQGFTLPRGFESTDYEEDGRASFIDPDNGLVLLVDEVRASSAQTGRFTLYQISLFNEPLATEPLIQSSDYDAVLHFIDEYRRSLAETDPCDAAPITEPIR